MKDFLKGNLWKGAMAALGVVAIGVSIVVWQLEPGIWALGLGGAGIARALMARKTPELAAHLFSATLFVLVNFFDGVLGLLVLCIADAPLHFLYQKNAEKENDRGSSKYLFAAMSSVLFLLAWYLRPSGEELAGLTFALALGMRLFLYLIALSEDADDSERLFDDVYLLFFLGAAAELFPPSKSLVGATIIAAAGVIASGSRVKGVAPAIMVTALLQLYPNAKVFLPAAIFLGVLQGRFLVVGSALVLSVAIMFLGSPLPSENLIVASLVGIGAGIGGTLSWTEDRASGVHDWVMTGLAAILVGAGVYLLVSGPTQVSPAFTDEAIALFSSVALAAAMSAWRVKKKGPFSVGVIFGPIQRLVFHRMLDFSADSPEVPNITRAGPGGDMWFIDSTKIQIIFVALMAAVFWGALIL